MIGRHVEYIDAGGSLHAAFITAVRGGPQQLVRLAVIGEDATLSDEDQVPFGNEPQTWRWLSR